jgi:hypothetical protein
MDPPCVEAAFIGALILVARCSITAGARHRFGHAIITLNAGVPHPLATNAIAAPGRPRHLL